MRLFVIQDNQSKPSVDHTIKLSFDEVHPVSNLLLNSLDVLQQVDLPLVLLSSAHNPASIAHLMLLRNFLQKYHSYGQLVMVHF